MTPILLLALALQAAPNGPAAADPAPSPPPPAASAAPAAASPPRRIDDLSHPLTGAVPQGAYEAGVRGAFSRTQSLQGPLDGTWTLKDATGSALYRIQLVDPGFGGGAIEGAWSDLRAGAAAPSGFFTAVRREGTRLTLEFAEAGAVAASLDAAPAGGFSGELRLAGPGRDAKDAKTAAVTLVRP